MSWDSAYSEIYFTKKMWPELKEEDFVNIIMFVLLIGVTLVFTLLARYFDKFLRGGTCKICLNFSCAMNKTPEDIRVKFFQKSPTMANAWEK